MTRWLPRALAFGFVILFVVLVWMGSVTFAEEGRQTNGVAFIVAGLVALGAAAAIEYLAQKRSDEWRPYDMGVGTS